MSVFQTKSLSLFDHQSQPKVSPFHLGILQFLQKSTMSLFLRRSLTSRNLFHSISIPNSLLSHSFNSLKPLPSTHPDTHMNLKSIFDVVKVKFIHTVTEGIDEAEVVDVFWKLKDEARSAIGQEPILSNYYHTSILRHNSLESILADYLSLKLADSSLPSGTLNELFAKVLVGNKDVISAVEDDLRAVKERDPACDSYLHCLLNFKGFLACQAYRIAHELWLEDRKLLALMIQSRISEVFAMDIHPGARIGSGILFDHATGIVVGETAVIGNDVSILHNVTLGGTGKMSGDRHPKIGDGVLIGAGTSVLGNIRIGEGAKIGAGSVVLKDVQPWTTVVGNPARIVGGKESPVKLDKKPSLTMDHTSHVADWYDYCV